MSPPTNGLSGNDVALATLNLGSLRRLEHLLGFPRLALRRIAESAGKYYKPFPKEDVLRPFQKKFKKIRKVREIDNPTGELKTIQRIIYERILKPIPLPANVLGGISGRTISDNALFHIGGSTLAKIDIKSFFPSITNCHIYSLWRNSLNCSPQIASLLTKLTTFRRRLPQGASTSTPLANLVIVSLDAKIRSACHRQGVQYSDWVDDLAFSGENPRPIVNIAIRELAIAGFAVSRTKVKIMGPSTQKILTGTRIGRIPHAHPQQHAWVRSGIHKLIIGAVPAAQVEQYVHSLAGRIGHIASIEPKRAERLADNLRAAAERKLPHARD